MRTGSFFSLSVAILPKAFYRRCLNLLFFSFILSPFLSFSQSNQCDEVPVTLIVDYFGRTELPSILCGDRVYYSVPGLLNFLQVKNEASHDLKTVKGFLVHQEDTFLVDEPEKQITYKNTVYKLNPEDLIRTRTDLFLKADFFSTILGLKNEFNSRNLAATLESEFELPAVKAAKRKQMRENLKEVQGEFLADTTISRDRPFLYLGTAEWNVYTSQNTEGFFFNRLDLGLGGILAGGEFTGGVNCNSAMEFSSRNLFYQWKHVNNQRRLYRQLTLGKIGSRSISSLYHPVVGFQVTNAPTFLKRSFGTYTLSDYTKPEWIVELYINNVLVDYTRADASGFYSFDVPLTYGTTNVSLRFFGPWGEEEVSNQQFNIPFNFLSPGKFQYSLSSGIVENNENSKFFHGRADYGLSEEITVGGGIEYFSALEKKPFIPFLNTSIRLPGNVFLSGEYMHNVGYKGNFSYTSPSSIKLDLSYKSFKEEQEAVRFGYLEERKASFSVPLNVGKFTGTSRFNFQQNVLQNSMYTNLEWLLSGNIWGLRANLTNTAFINDYSDPLVYSRLSTAIRLPRNLVFSPKVEFEYLRDGFTSFEGELRKRFFKKLNFQTSYSHNLRFDQFYFNIGINFDLGFTRVGMNSNTNKRYTSFSQSVGGSVLLDSYDNSLTFDHRPAIGRGSVKFMPFLDLNGNGIKEQNEKELEGVNVHIHGGGMREQIPGGVTIFNGLEPYISYYFTLDTRNLKNISWQVNHESMEVFINPNQMKLIKIPVKVVGEVAGFVNLDADGIGGIKINIYDSEEKLITNVISEADGYFSYMGLPSGDYVAKVDKAQMENLNLKVKGDFPFNIHNTREGDYVDNLEFFLSEKVTGVEEIASEGHQQSENILVEEDASEATENASAIIEESGAKEIDQATSEETDVKGIFETAYEEEKLAKQIASEENPERLQGKITPQDEGLVYRVQFLTSKNAIFGGDSRYKGLRHVVTEKTASGYRYLWGETRLPGEGAALQNELRRSGFVDAYVVHYYNGQRISVEEAVSIRTGEIVPSNNVSGEKQERTENLQPEMEIRQEGLQFKVQIAASNVPLDTTDFHLKGINGVEVYLHENMYKYSLGNFNSFGEANQYKNVLRSQGLADAFVVPFHNATRLEQPQKQGTVFFNDSNLKGIGGISLAVRSADGKLISKILSEADGSFVTPNLEPGKYTLSLNGAELKEIGMRSENESVSFKITGEGAGGEKLQFVLVAMEGTPADIKDKDEGLVFKVQVLASVPNLPVDHRLLRGMEQVSRYRHNGLYKYTVGESDNLESIRRVQKEIRKSGFEDAFIVTFLNGTRINLQEMTGHVFVKSGKEKQGLEGFNIQIFQNEKLITSLTSNQDGQFYFLGFKPGSYIAKLDERQLQELQLKLKTSSHKFEIQRNSEGVIKQPVLFELERVEDRTLDKRSAEQNAIEYRIQLAASNVRLGPNHPTLKGIENVSMYKHGGMFKYTVGSTYSLREARDIMAKLSSSHEFTLFIVGFRQGKRVMILE